MTPRDQQKFMFEKQTVSVWDLANFEEQVIINDIVYNYCHYYDCIMTLFINLIV